MFILANSGECEEEEEARSVVLEGSKGQFFPPVHPLAELNAG